jgi:hypothetical protein
MNLKYIREVSADQEYFGDSDVTHAVIEITLKLLVWINKARKALKSLEADGIELYDYTPEYKRAEVEEPTEDTLHEADFKVDGSILHVQDSRIYWSMYEKHSNVPFSISCIDYTEMDENLKVLRTKPTLLPLMLDHLEYDTSKLLLNERLRTK